MPDKNIAVAQLIAQRVAENGGRVYYVGGFVRDSLCGVECKDIDIEVYGISPEALMEILGSFGKPRTMGASFGIIGLSGYDLDISMPRKENFAGKGTKDNFASYVDPFIDKKIAAERRDFTVNSLMQDVLSGEISDFFGGIEDLKEKKLRHTAKDCFESDPLRVLRAAQLCARYGFEICEETKMLAQKADLSSIACERVFEEMKKALLKSDKPSVFFENLRTLNALDAWFPEVKALIGVEQPPQFHPEGDVWRHTMLVLDCGALLRHKAENPLGFMLSLLCHDFGKAVTTTNTDGRIRSIGHECAGVGIAKKFIQRLTADIDLNRYIANMIELHMRPNIIADQHSGSKAFCKLFDASLSPCDLLLVSEADFCGCATNEPYEDKRRSLEEKLSLFRERMAKPYVTGDDLIKAGYKPGKSFGGALCYAHKLRLAGVPKKEALCQTRAYIKKLSEENKGDI